MSGSIHGITMVDIIEPEKAGKKLILNAFFMNQPAFVAPGKIGCLIIETAASPLAELLI